MARRAGRMEPTVYFGRPGALVQMPWPKGDLGANYDRQTYDFVTATGGHRVSRLLGGARQYTLAWEALHQTTYDRVSGYWLGHEGSGPFVLIDPSRPNLLMPNQSAATGVWNDARGFTPAVGVHGAVTSNTNLTHVHRTGALRSLKWALTGSLATFPVLNLDAPYRNWYGIPVVVGLSYAWSAWVKPVTDASMDISVKIGWLDATGSQLSEPSGGTTTVTTWTRLNVIATAPANAVYAVPRFVAVASSITPPAEFYVDEPLFEQDNVVNDWAPGTGVAPVQVIQYPDIVPFDGRFRLGPAMVVREVVG